MWKNQKGFTVIEVLIALTIVAIVTAFAATAYSGYKVRATAAEADKLMSTLEDRVQAYYADNDNTLPANNADLGAGALATGYSGRYVQQVGVTAAGSLVAMYYDSAPVPAQLRAQTYTYLPYVNGVGVLSYHCAGGVMPAGMTSLDAAPNLANEIADEYKPAHCQP